MSSNTTENHEFKGYDMACDRCGGTVSVNEIRANLITDEQLCPWCAEETDKEGINLLYSVFSQWKKDLESDKEE
jgi:hypothetical protein